MPQTASLATELKRAYGLDSKQKASQAKMHRAQGNILMRLPAALVKTIKRMAGEKRQTFSAVAEDWLLKGQAEYEATKAPEK
jgi:hypothetical protein